MPRNSKNKAKQDYRNIIQLYNHGLKYATIQSIVNCSRSKVKDTVNFYRHACNQDFEFFRTSTREYQKPLMAQVALEESGQMEAYVLYLSEVSPENEPIPDPELPADVYSVLCEVSACLLHISALLDKLCAPRCER